MTIAGAGDQSKGERTRRRILEVAEELFADQGYRGTTLRQIAAGAGIQEPGLYNYFPGKQALYEAVLDRAITPLIEVLGARLGSARELRDYTELPAVLTDLLATRPRVALLLQQTIQDSGDSTTLQPMRDGLADLFNQGLENIAALGASPDQDRATMAINAIALLNTITGFFAAQETLYAITGSKPTTPDNLALQKGLLRKIVRSILIS